MTTIAPKTICNYEPKTKDLPKIMSVKVVGIAISEQPIIGYGYIVEVLDGSLPSTYYPYTHIIAFENNLHPRS